MEWSVSLLTGFALGLCFDPRRRPMLVMPIAAAAAIALLFSMSTLYQRGIISGAAMHDVQSNVALFLFGLLVSRPILWLIIALKERGPR